MWRWRAVKRKRFLSSMYVTFKCQLGEDAAVSPSATVWHPRTVPPCPLGKSATVL